jgi:hypothetical protein
VDHRREQPRPGRRPRRNRRRLRRDDRGSFRRQGEARASQNQKEEVRGVVRKVPDDDVDVLDGVLRAAAVVAAAGTKVSRRQLMADRVDEPPLVLGDHIEAFSVGQVAAIIIIIVVVIVVIVIVVAVVVVFDWRGRGAAPPSPSFAAAGEKDRIVVVVL